MGDIFATSPIIIAIRDDKWTGVLVDSYDNDPVYYEHHVGNDFDGFVPRGNHYIVVEVTRRGSVLIGTGYHKEELPARAFVMEG